MEQQIIHACGHEQVHYLTGFSSEQDRKARWLRTTKCRACFSAEKRIEQAHAAEAAEAVVAHLALPPLTGSERQIAWAATIRATRLATMTNDKTVITDTQRACLVTEAKWWIDHRDLPDGELIAKAAMCPTSSPLSSPVGEPPIA